MSENVELIRRWVDAWNRADLEAFVGFYDSDAEVITDPRWLDPGPFRGEVAIRRFFEDMRRAWAPDIEFEITHLQAMGNLVVVRVGGQVRGRSSGIDSDLSLSNVTNFQHGEMKRQQWYFTLPEALEAAGLSG